MEYEPINPFEIYTGPENDKDRDPLTSKKKKRKGLFGTDEETEKTNVKKTEQKPPEKPDESNIEKFAKKKPIEAVPTPHDPELEPGAHTPEAPAEELPDLEPTERKFAKKFERADFNLPTDTFEAEEDTPEEDSSTRTPTLSRPFRPIRATTPAPRAATVPTLPTRAVGGGSATPPPPTTPPPAAPGGGAGGAGLPPRPPGGPIGSLGPNVVPPTPNTAPNILNNPNVVVDSRAENLGFFAVGFVLGFGFEYLHRKRSEKRLKRDSKKTARAHREEKVALRSELDAQQLKTRRFEVQIDGQYGQPKPEFAPLNGKVAEKEPEMAPNFAQKLEPEPIEQSRERRPEPQPVASETSAEFGRTERRDTTPEVVVGQQGGQDIHGGGYGVSGAYGSTPPTPAGKLEDQPSKSSPFQPLGVPSRQAQQARPLIITGAIAFIVVVGFIVWLLIR